MAQAFLALRNQLNFLDKIWTIHLTRRQVCGLGGILGLFLSNLGPFRAIASAEHGKTSKGETAVNLPAPILDGDMSLEKSIKQRRTIRSFVNKPITLQQFSQLVWAAQGITGHDGLKRTAPSGGALYPGDVYAVVGHKGVTDLSAGIYRYHPPNHSVERICEGDRRVDVASASLGQMWMATAPVLFVITAQYSRITGKYGDRGIRYALIEVGHIGQNVLLQSQTLGLGAGIVGAFSDRQLTKAIEAQRYHEPLVVLPVGWKA